MFRAPTRAGLPDLSTMLSDLPPAPAVAAHLGISRRTLHRYALANQAPRAVMLALFWETRWGISAADCAAFNAAQLATGHAAVLRRQVDRLRGVVNKLENERTGRIIAVNSPVFQAF